MSAALANSHRIGSIWGYRLQPRQDFSGPLGRLQWRRGLRRRGAGGTRSHGGGRHPRSGPKSPL